MLKIVDRLRRGQGRLEDLKILEEVGDNIGIMPGTTICGLADGAGWPVKKRFASSARSWKQYIRSGQKASALPLAGGSLTAERGRPLMTKALLHPNRRECRVACGRWCHPAPTTCHRHWPGATEGLEPE